MNFGGDEIQSTTDGIPDFVGYDQETVLQKQRQQVHDEYFSLICRIQCVGDAKEKELDKCSITDIEWRWQQDMEIVFPDFFVDKHHAWKACSGPVVDTFLSPKTSSTFFILLQLCIFFFFGEENLFFNKSSLNFCRNILTDDFGTPEN